jgi:hypothetical protein
MLQVRLNDLGADKNFLFQLFNLLLNFILPDEAEAGSAEKQPARNTSGG